MRKTIGILLCFAVLFVSVACQPRYAFVPPIHNVITPSDPNEDVRSDEAVLPEVEEMLGSYIVVNDIKLDESEVDEFDESSGSKKGIIFDEKFLKAIADASGSVSDLYIDFGSISGTSISILGANYREGDTTDISIGNNVFYRAPIFKIEDGKLLLNKVVLMFSAISGTPVIVDGESYSYSLADGESITANNLRFTSDDKGTITLDKTNEYTIVYKSTRDLITYDYENKVVGDSHFIVTKNPDNPSEVISTSIDSTSASDFGFYLYPYGADPSEQTPRDVIKESYVFGSDGEFKGCVKLLFHISIDTNL